MDLSTISHGSTAHSLWVGSGGDIDRLPEPEPITPLMRINIHTHGRD
jgi:hypothetical protein